MAGNPQRWRAAIPLREQRIATAGCLLTVLFIVPFLALEYHINFAILAFFVLIYVTVVVPIMTGMMSKKFIFKLLRFIRSNIILPLKFGTKALIRRALWLWHRKKYRKLPHYLEVPVALIESELGLNFIRRITFAVAAEKVICPEQYLSSLFVLLFYYFIYIIWDSSEVNRYTMVDIDELDAHWRSSAKISFKESLYLDQVLLSNSFLFFAIPLRHLEPSKLFWGLTFVFFCLTEDEWVSKLQKDLNRFMGLAESESTYISRVLHYFPVGMSVALCNSPVYFCSISNFFLMILLGYTNIYSRIAYKLHNHREQQSNQVRGILCGYKFYKLFQCKTLIENRCAICWSEMKFWSAVRTSCGHIFHRFCLQKSLSAFRFCPLCKTEIYNFKF